MNNLSSYCGLTGARMRATEKNFPAMKVNKIGLFLTPFPLVLKHKLRNCIKSTQKLTSLSPKSDNVIYGWYLVSITTEEHVLFTMEFTLVDLAHFWLLVGTVCAIALKEQQ